MMLKQGFSCVFIEQSEREFGLAAPNWNLDISPCRVHHRIWCYRAGKSEGRFVDSWQKGREGRWHHEWYDDLYTPSSEMWAQHSSSQSSLPF